MNILSDPNLWVICGLFLLLGLLLGVLVTAGGRRKWKARYNAEVERRREFERRLDEREKHWAEQEKDWRERDSLRSAAAKDRRDPADDRPL